jgi:hypothetical protein
MSIFGNTQAIGGRPGQTPFVNQPQGGFSVDRKPSQPTAIPQQPSIQTTKTALAPALGGRTQMKDPYAIDQGHDMYHKGGGYGAMNAMGNKAALMRNNYGTTLDYDLPGRGTMMGLLNQLRGLRDKSFQEQQARNAKSQADYNFQTQYLRQRKGWNNFGGFNPRDTFGGGAAIGGGQQADQGGNGYDQSYDSFAGALGMGGGQQTAPQPVFGGVPTAEQVYANRVQKNQQLFKDTGRTDSLGEEQRARDRAWRKSIQGVAPEPGIVNRQYSAVPYTSVGVDRTGWNNDPQSVFNEGGDVRPQAIRNGANMVRPVAQTNMPADTIKDGQGNVMNSSMMNAGMDFKDARQWQDKLPMLEEIDKAISHFSSPELGVEPQDWGHVLAYTSFDKIRRDPKAMAETYRLWHEYNDLRRRGVNIIPAIQDKRTAMTFNADEPDTQGFANGWGV